MRIPHSPRVPVCQQDAHLRQRGIAHMRSRRTRSWQMYSVGRLFEKQPEAWRYRINRRITSAVLEVPIIIDRVHRTSGADQPFAADVRLPAKRCGEGRYQEGAPLTQCKFPGMTLKRASHREDQSGPPFRHSLSSHVVLHRHGGEMYGS